MRTIASLLPFLALGALVAQDIPADPSVLLAKPDRGRDQELAQKSAAFQAFLRQNGGSWTSQWNPATGTPKAIFGDGLRLTDWRGDGEAEARRHAEWVLQQHHELLGLGTSEFREEIAAKMGQTWVLVYDQYYRGLPVIGGRADVRIHQSGVLAMFGSKAWPVPADFVTTPAIDRLNAERIAWQTLGKVKPEVAQPGRGGEPRLVIWGEVEADVLAPLALCWEVPVSAVEADGSGPIGRYLVDARTGAVLRYENDKHECFSPACRHSHHRLGNPGAEGPPALAPISGTVMAWTRTGLSSVSPLSNIPLAGLEVVVPGVGTAITDQNGFFSINSTLTAPVNVTVNLDGIHSQLVAGANAPTQTLSVTPGTPATFQLLTAGATSNESAHTSTYHWVYAVNEFHRSILGNSAQLATADNVRATVNIASTCNAYYTGNTINFYAAGGNCNNTGFSTVVAHEWGHGIDDRYGGISQTNGLSEGWGDICAMYLVGDPIVGRDFTTSGGIVRTGTNTRQYPGGSGVHQQGESWMGFAWKLRERLRSTLGVAAGTARANSIVIGTLPADSTNQADAVLQVFIADDNDGNLNNGTPNYNDIVWACQQHSLPYPPIVLGTIAHTPLPNTTTQLTPRMLNVTATPIGGTFSQVRLHYDQGTGPQVRPMIDNGLPNGYRALLPGVLAPGAVSYHFEAVHSTGGTVRFPASGEFSTVTGNQLLLLAEDFEGGGVGWTHGMVATQDDWQVGTPLGRSGTSSGVTWADPSAAASGLRCYGNDLGPTGWNGAYTNNVNNWLRSPTFSTLGQTGVTLRFKRWLTVEDGAFDRASIHVNGVQVWVNASGAHHRDTAWTQVELAIPNADNLPSVTLEWRLQSDASLTLGGWNIDDVEVFVAGSLPPLDAQLRISPEQVQLGAPMAMSALIRPNTPFLLILGDTAGPTTIAGIPTLLVGGNYATLPEWTDALGLFLVGFNAPSSPATAGTMWYSQLLTIDPSFDFVVSNQWVNLFTN